MANANPAHPHKPPSEGSIRKAVPALPADMQYHVFLTHDWGKDENGEDNHEKVACINKALQTRGFVTWFDEDRMEGNIIDQMTAGIDDSACIAVFITSNYETKVRGRGPRGAEDNCKLEFEYAHNHKGVANSIPVVMEGRMMAPGNWKGPVGMVFGKILYKTNFSNVPISSRADFEKQVDNLADEIISKCNKY